MSTATPRDWSGDSSSGPKFNAVERTRIRTEAVAGKGALGQPIACATQNPNTKLALRPRPSSLQAATQRDNSPIMLGWQLPRARAIPTFVVPTAAQWQLG
jgi:hypothetical protein